MYRFHIIHPFRVGGIDTIILSNTLTWRGIQGTYHREGLLPIAARFGLYFARLTDAAGGLELRPLQLPLHQGGVDAVAGEELVVRASLHNLAVGDDGDGVGTLHGREPVSYH